MKSLNRSAIGLAALSILLFLIPPQSRGDLSTNDFVYEGKTKRIAVITNVTPVGVDIIFEGRGGVHVNRRDLPEHLRARYPVDPAEEEKYQKRKNQEKNNKKSQDFLEVKNGQLRKLQEAVEAVQRQRRAEENLILTLEDQLQALQQQMADLWDQSRELGRTRERREHAALVPQRRQLQNNIAAARTRVALLDQHLESFNKQMEEIKRQIDEYTRQLETPRKIEPIEPPAAQ